jgi:hypothetical protein
LRYRNVLVFPPLIYLLVLKKVINLLQITNSLPSTKLAWLQFTLKVRTVVFAQTILSGVYIRVENFSEVDPR